MFSIYCADVGSVPNDHFGWFGQNADGTTASGSRPDELASAVAASLRRESAVALGFECPLFVPVPPDEAALGKARTGEGNRAWSAGAGTGALATGLVQAAWVLRRIRAEVHDAEFTLDARAFVRSPQGILIWEAFVSGGAHGMNHIADAEAATRCFLDRIATESMASDVTCDPALSLAGAAILFAGGQDLSVIRSACHVVRV